MFEGTPKSYRDPFWSNLAGMAEREVGLPDGLLRSILTKGERSNADQVSSAGAKTPFQVIPQTRDALVKKYGVDAYESPESAAKAAALVLKEGLERNGGDIKQAVGEYIGGVNRRNWGPVTRSYIERVTGQKVGEKMASARPSQVDELVRMFEEQEGGSDTPKKSERSKIDELISLYEKTEQGTNANNSRQKANQKEMLASKEVAALQPQLKNQPAKKEKPGFIESLTQGSIVDPISGGAQLLTNVLPKSVVDTGNRLNNFIAEKTGLVAPIPAGGINEMVKKQQADYEARQGGGLDPGRIAGAVLSPANMALAGAAPLKLMASGLGRVAAGAGLGGISGAFQPITNDDYNAQLAKNVGLGAFTGGALSGAGEAVAKVISPKASVNPDIRALKDMGVAITPGQALGPTASKIEQRLQSVPIAGGAIEARRAEGLQKFSNAMFNKAGKSIGFKTGKIGFEAVQDLNEAVNKAYSKALGKTRSVSIDDEFLNKAGNLSQMASEVADNGATKKALDSQIDLILSKVTKAGKVAPETWKEFDAKLGEIIRKTGNRDYKNSVRELQSQWRGMAARSNPEQAELFRSADAAYSRLITLEKAAEAAAKQDGLFSPNQLYRAARSNTITKSSVRNKSAPFMKEALAAERVIGGNVANSGTAERLMTGGLFGGAGIAVDPSFLVAPVLGGLAYSPVASKVLTSSITSRPNFAQPVAQAIQKTSPLLGLIAPQLTE